MKDIPNKSIDLILCDLPYGIERFKTIKGMEWDKQLDITKLWEIYKRIIKDEGYIILFAKQPFTSLLVASNLEMFRYELIWEKDKGTDFGNANKKPLNAHENILVYYKKRGIYNKQLEKGKPYVKINKRNNEYGDTNFDMDNSGIWINEGYRTPKSVIKIARDNIHKGKSFHPTQKPVTLCEWLICSFTDKNMVVLDNCMGSGSTGVACMNTNRQFIGIELDKNYFEIAEKRIKEADKNA
jgi:site-specific DNA-methyltransferase (adenine-specific)